MIVVMTLPALTKVGIMINFEINRDFIAEVLCINKEQPITMCEGQCYLADQLQKSEEQNDKRAPGPGSEKLEVVYYYLTGSLKINKRSFASSNKTELGDVNNSYSSTFIADIFRPPQFILT